MLNRLRSWFTILNHPYGLALLRQPWLLGAVLLIVFLVPMALAQSTREATPPLETGRYVLDVIPQLSISDSSLTLPELLLPFPTTPFQSLLQDGPTYARPDTLAHFEIQLANFAAVSRTYQLENRLPAGLDYQPGSADGLSYDAAKRSLTWTGTLPPGQLNYVIEPTTLPIPYLDLADFGVPNLCDPFLTAGQPCEDVAVTFNLGSSSYSAPLFARELSQITLTSNGLLTAGEGPDTGRNQWLPEGTAPNELIAPLWRDVDMTTAGRWHAAIISDLLPGHDLFYAQWHDAPQRQYPDQTARFALAFVLNHHQVPEPQPLSGHLYFIYDNIADPAGTMATGYTIGIEDQTGSLGTTHAFAPCCGAPQVPQGQPPSSGSVLHLRPVVFDHSGSYQQGFRFAAVVTGDVSETLVNTVFVQSDSTAPDRNILWDSHYLYVRWQYFLPLLLNREAGW